MPPQRQNTAARTPGIAEQKLNDRSSADHLRARGMLGPPERVGDCARALAARVPAEQLCHLDHILGTAAACSRYRVRSVARVMPLHNLQDAHRMLERRIGLW